MFRLRPMLIVTRSSRYLELLEAGAARHASTSCKKLVFEEFGEPLKVLKLQEESIPELKRYEVLAKFIVAPINPADINLIQGVYPIKVTFPAVGGSEGVAEIVAVGEDVKDLQVGDRVISNIEVIGTWRTHGVFNSKSLLKVSKDVNAVEMAGISSNPSTAYRMLTDFVQLKPGDVIIQNAANSACGQNVIQLCKARGIISVNVVRDRPEISQLKSYLNSIGADYVFTQEELRSTELFKSGECAKPKLALNAVGGKTATDISRQLDNGGVIVTYGGMSREPVTFPTSSFIFKDLTCRGFWMTSWTKCNRYSSERMNMLNDLSELMKKGKLKAPAHKILPISQYETALKNTGFYQGFAGFKYFLDLQSE